jgi:opacity protein-like surface antigen
MLKKSSKTMKKKALLLLALTVVSASIFAQDKKLRLGLTLFPTVNVFKPDVNGLEKTKNGVGFSYGLLADYAIGENYAFSTGLHISTFNGTLSYKDSISEGSIMYQTENEAKLKLKYIEIPLTLKLRTNEIGYITYYGQFGLGLGVNIKATQKSETKYTANNEAKTLIAEDKDIADDIKLFRTALIVGAGIEYSISGNTAIQLGFTFNNGFSNILNGTVPNTGTKKSATNNVFALNLGIFF